jgi:hypothetical protein
MVHPPEAAGTPETAALKHWFLFWRLVLENKESFPCQSIVLQRVMIKGYVYLNSMNRIQ